MRSKLARIFTALLGIFYIVWFFLPVTIGENSELLTPFTMGNIFLYIIPLFGLLKIISFFVSKKIKWQGISSYIFRSILRFSETFIMLYTVIIPILNNAESIEYFIDIPLYIAVLAAVVIIVNIYSTVMLMIAINRTNDLYDQYQEFKKGTRGANLLFRIRTKLISSFIIIITVIIVILSIQLLDNYKTTLLKSIGDAANNQVQQSSANYRINIGDTITLFEYFERQIELNQKASFKYNDLSIYTNFKTKYYIGDVIKEIEDYPCEYSTLAPKKRLPELESLTSNHVKDYLSKTKNGSSVFSTIAGEHIKFISPIIKNDTVLDGDNKIKKERLLGFSIISFDTKVIMKPYFMIRNLVIVLTILFLYISIILIYLVGNIIVNPILYLRMNVKNMSTILKDMISGETRVNSNSLIYSDNIKSRDEIKYLSKEINDMVTIIKGIIPYISASTLKHSDKKELVSMEKDIAFLFTDIRGFTTLCEGMAPNEVVAVLNKYLNLETEIILNNGGDVDKFVGDEVMAFFEGPDKEKNACRAAMQIRRAMLDEKDIREEQGLPIVDIGLGINTGKVVFGSVGSADRMDFTSIGDTVNLAARLEGANKAFNSKSLISEAVFKEVKDDFLCRELDSIAVKGKIKPVRIYEIIQEASLITPKLLEIKELFEAGLKEYRANNWEGALVNFKMNVDLYNDEPSKVFIQRINHFIAIPPSDDWDGVFRMVVK